MRGLGATIKARREDKCMTVRELSVLAEIDKGYLGRIESGARPVNAYWFIKLTYMLGVPYDEAKALWRAAASLELRHGLDKFTAEFDGDPYSDKAQQVIRLVRMAL